MKALTVMVQILTAPIAAITGLGVVFETIKGRIVRSAGLFRSSTPIFNAGLYLADIGRDSR
jgi:hypothetical protein